MDSQQQKRKKIVLYKVQNHRSQKSKRVNEGVNAKIRAFNKYNKKQKIEPISKNDITSESSTSTGTRFKNCFNSKNALDLLNDLVSLNDESFEENEQDIDQEVNKIRAKYQLPPLTTSQLNSINYTLTHQNKNEDSPVNIEGSDDEDENTSTYSENIGKDSGCDIDDCSENIEMGGESKIFESKISIEEAKLDVDSYYEDKCSEKVELGLGIYNLTRDLDKKLKCDKCGATFPSELNHKDHIIQKHSDGTFHNKCSICLFKCKNFGELKRHVTTHHVKRRSSSSDSSLEIIEID